ncbi:hypothetical protein CXB51_031150 [Gossypium anomalum]|uniref:Reverse transcriptase Ty1/copia-type domain-containing protein n=1 Tax=Gossypium anomalum TaxID=47600 RepID=A0A8J5XR44_9ROSI|nr:hypothetical protein CXB51_031150 [Gossypium anomalum]
MGRILLVCIGLPRILDFNVFDYLAASGSNANSTQYGSNFDDSYVPLPVGTSSWYPDSEATHHTQEILLRGQACDGLYQFLTDLSVPSDVVPTIHNTRVHDCSSDNDKGKSHKLPFAQSTTEYMELFDLVVSDLWGPASVACGSSLFVNHGILHHLSCPHTSEQNSVAERKHRHIEETVLKGQSPYQAFHDHKPAYDHLRDIALNIRAITVSHQPPLIDSLSNQEKPLHHHPFYILLRLLNPDLTILMFHQLKPRTVEEALAHKEWKLVVQVEYDALMANCIWELVSLPPSRKAIGCKWLFKVKKNPDGTEKFSLVVKPATILTILSIVVTNVWQLRQIDVNNTFLNGDITDEVFMQQPPGYVRYWVNGDALVCRITKALYGLRQAPHVWFDKFKQFLISNGFVLAKSDDSLFVKVATKSIVYVLIYVDDIIITRSSTDVIKCFIQQLHNEFSLKDLGDLHYFLGIEVSWSSTDSLHLCQRKYIWDLLNKCSLANAKSVRMPMISSSTLSKDEGTCLADPIKYRSLTGALQYMVLTRPDIAYAQVVSRSTTKAEYRSLAAATSDVAWLVSLFTELQIGSTDPTAIWYDNSSAVVVAANPVFTPNLNMSNLTYFLFAKRRLVAHLWLVKYQHVTRLRIFLLNHYLSLILLDFEVYFGSYPLRSYMNVRVKRLRTVSLLSVSY